MRRQSAPIMERTSKHQRILTRRSPAALLGLVAAVAAVGFGCSSKTTTTNTSTSAPPAAARTTAAAPTTPVTPESMAPSATPTTSAAASGLSGTWSGSYAGAFSGTFQLTWTQTGNNLNGTINLSTSPGDTPLSGTLNGSTITFGTVGSTAITYTGTVSGSSMSGSYQVQGGPVSAGGTWKATKM